MGFFRKAIALVAWIVIDIPTTFFVIYVMVKVFIENRSKKSGARS